MQFVPCTPRRASVWKGFGLTSSKPRRLLRRLTLGRARNRAINCGCRGEADHPSRSWRHSRASPAFVRRNNNGPQLSMMP